MKIISHCKMSLQNIISWFFICILKLSMSCTGFMTFSWVQLHIWQSVCGVVCVCVCACVCACACACARVRVCVCVVLCIWSPGAWCGEVGPLAGVCNWPLRVSAGVCENMSSDSRPTQTYLSVCQHTRQIQPCASDITTRLHQMRSHTCVFTANQSPLSRCPTMHCGIWLHTGKHLCGPHILCVWQARMMCHHFHYG